jgi:hypothetical protein
VSGGGPGGGGLVVNRECVWVQRASTKGSARGFFGVVFMTPLPPAFSFSELKIPKRGPSRKTRKFGAH